MLGLRTRNQFIQSLGGEEGLQSFSIRQLKNFHLLSLAREVTGDAEWWLSGYWQFGIEFNELLTFQ